VSSIHERRTCCATVAPSAAPVTRAKCRCQCWVRTACLQGAKIKFHKYADPTCRTATTQCNEQAPPLLGARHQFDRRRRSRTGIRAAWLGFYICICGHQATRSRAKRLQAPPYSPARVSKVASAGRGASRNIFMDPSITHLKSHSLGSLGRLGPSQDALFLSNLIDPISIKFDRL
jgi:hypothetical protein